MRPPLPTSRSIGGAWRLLVKEMGAFGVVGAVCLVIDLGLFQLLYAHADVGAVTARLGSTLVSMTVAYFAHRHWSFSHRARTGFRREYVLFVVVNGLTLLLNLAVVALVRYPLGQEDALVLQLVNLVSIGLGTVLRFLCYKKWVFPPAETAVASAPSSAR
ncbi:MULTISPECIES: GtrA family protein [unclassified Modestobacter]